VKIEMMLNIVTVVATSLCEEPIKKNELHTSEVNGKELYEDLIIAKDILDYLKTL
jgi:hypothetical protein